MRKTRSLRGTVRLQSTNGQVSDHFTFISKHASKIFLKHEISRRAAFTQRLITPDAARTTLRHSKPCQIRSLLMETRKRAVFATRRNPVKKSLRARTPETGHFSTRGKAKSR